MGWGWGRYDGYGRYGRAPKATKASAATLSTATLQRVLAQKQAQEQAQARWAVEHLDLTSQINGHFPQRRQPNTRESTA